nr:MAG TPA: hypothetical protein [Caudoviricetes sp.]
MPSSHIKLIDRYSTSNTYKLGPHPPLYFCDLGHKFSK